MAALRWKLGPMLTFTLYWYSRITTTSSLSSQDGRTALILASRYGHREIAQLLVDRGADVNTHDKVRNCAFLICLLLENFVSVLDF